MVTWIAAGLAIGGVGWVAVLWWRAGGGLTDRLLDTGDRLASMTSAFLAAAGVVLAYLVWRAPHRTDGPAAAPTSTSPGTGGDTEPGPGLAGAGRPGRPRQLPRKASGFTGRTAELEQLLELVPDPRQANAVVISAIDGMAGIGKTELAIYTAHRLVDRFPDGQLFIDLHGYTQDLAPIEPAEALDHLLRDLGIPGTQIPTNLDQRAALYRTRLADQRMLIVLDNAATEDQVAPLLPGTPGCLVLVTSRRRLAGLDHTHTLSLDTLPVPDAITLLAQTAGEGRLADQPPELVVELVELCDRLPLAIQIAAARLRSHPAWHLGDLVERLRDQQHRLGFPGVVSWVASTASRRVSAGCRVRSRIVAGTLPVLAKLRPKLVIRTEPH